MPKTIEQANDWIGLKAAAAYMHVNEKTLRQRVPGTNRWLHYPQLTRIQLVEKGNIYFLRSELAAWKQQVEEQARAARPIEFAGTPENPFTRLRDRLAAYPDLLRQLGVEG
ncbi:MAG: hypothetical protein JNK38_01020 [Acidobacteria bacterium]|nr:hypothetical protein [Acidobacteriota bacterium]